MDEKIFCEEQIKPDLSEDTLAHYGVKGMKWGKRKAKKANPNKKSTVRRLNKSKTEFGTLETLQRRLAEAKTDEERASIYAAIQNTYANQTNRKNSFRETNRGGNVSFVARKGAEPKYVSQYDIEDTAAWYRKLAENKDRERRRKKK